mmetsp:Transcript_23337/g.34594  ORF Transcript_23337/g.34594 Transcript_23337/m.34594 type:complete len:232 (-) Transcript_23337:2056-2751(-)
MAGIKRGFGLGTIGIQLPFSIARCRFHCLTLNPYATASSSTSRGGSGLLLGTELLICLRLLRLPSPIDVCAISSSFSILGLRPFSANLEKRLECTSALRPAFALPLRTVFTNEDALDRSETTDLSSTTGMGRSGEGGAGVFFRGLLIEAGAGASFRGLLTEGLTTVVLAFAVTSEVLEGGVVCGDRRNEFFLIRACARFTTPPGSRGWGLDWFDCAGATCLVFGWGFCFFG